MCKREAIRDGYTIIVRRVAPVGQILPTCPHPIMTGVRSKVIFLYHIMAFQQNLMHQPTSKRQG